MSFIYSQYGEGLDVLMPSSEAMAFSELVHLKGLDLTIIDKPVTGYDSYRQPIFTERDYVVKAFVETEPREKIGPSGIHDATNLKCFLKLWAPIGDG